MPIPNQNWNMPPAQARPPSLPEGYATTVEHLLSLATYRTIWKVPTHQRRYAWRVGTEGNPMQVDDFFNDLSAAIGLYPHSLGTIDTTREPNGPLSLLVRPAGGPNPSDDFETLLVNDGQQRLTTIFLAYAALTQVRSLSGDATYADPLDADPTIRQDAVGAMALRKEAAPTDVVGRLHLQVDALNRTFLSLMKDRDGAAFPGGVSSPVTDDEYNGRWSPPSRAEKNMVDAYAFFRRKFGSMLPVSLNEWEQSFYQAEISYIVSGTPPFMMFESRNTRGIRVSGLDIVKNWMLYAEDHWDTLGSPINSDPAAKWWEAQTAMDEGNGIYDEGKLLGHCMSINLGSSLGESGKDSVVFKNEFKISDLHSGSGKRDRFIRFVDSMSWIAQAMKEVYSRYQGGDNTDSNIPNGELAKMFARGMTPAQAAEALVNLTHITTRMDRENIASTMVLLTYQYLQPGDWLDFIKMLEKIIFRVHLVGRERLGNISTGQKQLGEYCQTFFSAVHDKDPLDPADHGDIENAFVTLKQSLCHWTLVERGATLTNLYDDIKYPANRYNGGAWTRYLLYHWEMAGPQTKNSASALRLQTNRVSWGDPSQNAEFFQLEHIAAKEGWRVSVPSNPRRAGFTAATSYWQSQFEVEDTYNVWKHRLGNLALSKRDPNIGYRNLPYIIAEADGEDERSDEKRYKYLNLPGFTDWRQIRAVGRVYKLWNKNTIEDRQERLARWAIRHWKLPCENDTLPLLEKMAYLDEHTDEFKEGIHQDLGADKERVHPEIPLDHEGGDEDTNPPSLPRDDINGDYDVEGHPYNEHDEYGDE